MSIIALTIKLNLYLYYYANSTIKDISKELKISESNVKHYLYRTLNELKILMNRGDKNV